MPSNTRTAPAPPSRRALLRTAVAGTAAAAGAGLTLSAAFPAFATSRDVESSETVTTPAQALRRPAAGDQHVRTLA
ncbi:hypothetical protein ACWGIU_31900 [Streptomyces sp. NPDC054840]